MSGTKARTDGEAVLRMLTLAGRSATVDPESRERYARQAAVLAQHIGVKWSKDRGFEDVHGMQQ